MAVTLLPRYPIPGYEEFTPEEAAEMLHQEKNRPDPIPSAVLRKVVRPWETLTAEEKAFPAAMYREWTDERREMARHRAAARLNMNLKNPLELEQVDQFIGAYESALAKSAEEQMSFRMQGWGDTPAEAQQLGFIAHRVLATSAAMSQHDDRHLTEKARDERNAVEDAAADHVAEIPRTPIPPQNKTKRGE